MTFISELSYQATADLIRWVAELVSFTNFCIIQEGK